MRAILAFFMCLFPLLAVSGSGIVYSYNIRSNSWISLSGTTNVNTFTCRSDGEIPNGNILADILPGSNAVYFSDASIDLEVFSFDCQNRVMNRDLHDALGGNDNPHINIKLKEIRPQQPVKAGSGGKIRAEFAITINGKSKNTDILIDYRQHNPHYMLISGSKDLLMSDFGIVPPSPALGLVKVRDKVTIHFHLLVETSLMTQAQ